MWTSLDFMNNHPLKETHTWTQDGRPELKIMIQRKRQRWGATSTFLVVFVKPHSLMWEGTCSCLFQAVTRGGNDLLDSSLLPLSSCRVRTWFIQALTELKSAGFVLIYITFCSVCLNTKNVKKHRAGRFWVLSLGSDSVTNIRSLIGKSSIIS